MTWSFLKKFENSFYLTQTKIVGRAMFFDVAKRSKLFDKQISNVEPTMFDRLEDGWEYVFISTLLTLFFSFNQPNTVKSTKREGRKKWDGLTLKDFEYAKKELTEQQNAKYESLAKKHLIYPFMNFLKGCGQKIKHCWTNMDKCMTVSPNHKTLLDK